MARPFEKEDRFDSGGLTPSIDRGAFADTAAMRRAPFDGDTAAMRNPPTDFDTAAMQRPPSVPDDESQDDFLRDAATAAFVVERPRKTRRRTSDAPESMSVPRIDSRYRLSEPIATGGMATVHLGVRDGDRRVYAIKRLHPEFAHDEYFAQMLLDEAAIAARIRHPNVVTMHGAGFVGDDLILVMEYVAGLTVADLIRAVHPRKLPPRMVTAIFADALRGLHAAHETFDEHGRPLDIVHRDVSPPNVLLGADGVARILDFGVAKAEHRAQTTRVGELKGKFAYMAPEQLNGTTVDRRVDVRAAAVVLWEALAGAPLFHAENESATAARVREGCSTPPSQVARGVPSELDAIVMRALATHPDERFDTALEMAEALEAVFGDDTPPSHEMAVWLTSIAADTLCKQWNVRAALQDDVTQAAPLRPRSLRSANPVPNASTTVAPISASSRHSAVSLPSDFAEPSSSPVPVPSAHLTQEVPSLRSRVIVMTLAVVAVVLLVSLVAIVH